MEYFHCSRKLIQHPTTPRRFLGSPIGLARMFHPDVMHTIPLGLVKILVDVLFELSGQAPSQQPEMDARFANIPRVRDPKQRVMAYRTFPTGITSMKLFTADDLVAILQQLAYVVGTRAAIIRDAETNKAFIATCFCVRDILVLMKKRSLTEHDVALLDDLVKKVGPLFDRCTSLCSEVVELNRPKIHALLHFV